MTQQSVYQFGGKSFVQNEWFVARITAVGTATGTTACDGVPYGWMEQRVCNSGNNYQNVEPDSRPRFGGTAENQSPAFPIGNGTAKVDDIVLMRPRGINANGYPIMEFLPKSSGGTGNNIPSAVSSVQCVGNTLYVTYGS